MTDAVPTTVLIIDDSRADARLMQVWLRNSALVRDVQSVRSGQEALQYLRREGPGAQTPMPDLILLDIHLPDMMGWDLLVELRRDERLSGIPVIVLTGTFSDKDAQRALELGAVRYRGKPFDADDFTALVGEIDRVIQEFRH